MKLRSYARKRRQLSFLLKKIEKLKRSHWSEISAGAKSRLLFKARTLLKFVKNSLDKTRIKKAMVVLGLIVGMHSGNLLQAQQAEFTEPVDDAFGMNRLGSFQQDVFVDLDNDGDLDILSQAYQMDNVDNSRNFFYSENLGDASNPIFGSPITDPFNIESSDFYLSFHTVADIDADGDFDVIQIALDSMTNENQFIFLENIGTTEVPDFVIGDPNPFGLVALQEGTVTLGVDLADLDNDGDFDLVINHIGNADTYFLDSRFYYFENIGDAQNPSFADHIESPFGLETSTGVSIGSNFVDIDKDGDFDLITNQYTPYSSTIIYYENTGAPSNPLFTSSDSGLNGLENDNIVYTLSFADLDDDGDVDAVTTPFDELVQTQYFENLCLVSKLVDVSREHEIILRPNPASTLMHIDIEGSYGVLNSLEVYDLLGANVLQQKIIVSRKLLVH